jgi:hypothetical protein
MTLYQDFGPRLTQSAFKKKSSPHLKHDVDGTRESGCNLYIGL